MKTILLAGAGSVGKTQLLEAIEQMGRERGLKVLVQKSTTRKSYAKAGIATEGEQMRRLGEANHEGVQELMAHQHQVMADNSHALVLAATRAREEGYDLLVADRSPYDYATYFCTVFQPHITLQTIQAKRQEADHAVEQVMRDAAGGVYVLYFPFPAPWSAETESSDGWRADKTGKNFIWSSLVNSELDEASRRFTSDLNRRTCELPVFSRLGPADEQGSPEVRAAAVLGQVFPNLR